MIWKRCGRKRSWHDSRHYFREIEENYKHPQLEYTVFGPRYKTETSEIQSRSASSFSPEDDIIRFFETSVYNQ
jgi:hypothetical protein